MLIELDKGTELANLRGLGALLILVRSFVEAHKMAAFVRKNSVDNDMVQVFEDGSLLVS